MIADTSLVDMINAKLEQDDVELPVFDVVAQRVYDAVQKDDFTADQMCALLEQDPALTSEVLRVANSSFYKGLGEVTQLQEAVVRLGAKHIASLAMAVSQKRIYSSSSQRFKRRLTRLWGHSSAAAFGCRWLARKAGYLDIADQAFVAGLLHDVGKVSLLRIVEDLESESEALDFSDPVIDMTLRELYCDHGAKLLELWNIPEVFRDVIRHQCDPVLDDGNVTLMIVRLVDMACAREGISDFPDPSVCLETSAEAQALGLNEIQLAELQVVLEDSAGLT